MIIYSYNYNSLKRKIDFFVALFLFVTLIPILVPVSIIIYLSLGSPILFRQNRPGLNGKPFKIYKFRTMSNRCDSNGQLLPDSMRMTKIGRFLRKSSLDELPELFNVLKGEMSLVGPRPLLMQYLERYTPEQMRRHEVRPGITGLAQINGRNSLTWKKRFQFDLWYINNLSLGLDMDILMKTLIKVIKSEGINQAGFVTMEEFHGEA